MPCMLELACDEWRADENRHERGKQIEPGQRAGQETVRLSESSLNLIAVGKRWMRDACADAQVLEVRGDLYPGDDQDRCQHT